MSRINGKSPANGAQPPAQPAPDEAMPLLGVPVEVSTQTAVVDLAGAGRRVVVLLQSANGIQQYYLDHEHARMLGQQLIDQARTAETGLVTPAGGGLITPL